MRIKISLPVEAFQARVSLVFTLLKKQVRKELIPSLEYDERQVLILRDFLINSILGKKATPLTMTFFILILRCSAESESLQTLDGSQTVFESRCKTSTLLVPLFKKQVRKELIPSLDYDERLVQILWDFL